MAKLDLRYYDTDTGQWVSSVANGADLSALEVKLTQHTSNTSNPHNVTKAQVGLENVDNTSDANKPISTATQNALNAKADKGSLSLGCLSSSLSLFGLIPLIEGISIGEGR